MGWGAVYKDLGDVLKSEMESDIFSVPVLWKFPCSSFLGEVSILLVQCFSSI